MKVQAHNSVTGNNRPQGFDMKLSGPERKTE